MTGNKSEQLKSNPNSLYVQYSLIESEKIFQTFQRTLRIGTSFLLCNHKSTLRGIRKIAIQQVNLREVEAELIYIYDVFYLAPFP